MLSRDLFKSIIFEGMQIEEKYRINIAGKSEINVTEQNGSLRIENQEATPDIVKINEHTIHLLWKNKGYTVELLEGDEDERGINLKVNGKKVSMEMRNRIEQMLDAMGIGTQTSQKTNSIKSPMPGMVLKVLVEPGMAITKGTPLVVLEAMKMENNIKASSDGVVKEVLVQPMMKVEKNFVMVVLE